MLNFPLKLSLLLRCHGHADARSDNLVYLLYRPLSSALCVPWVSKWPIIWQSSEMLSVQRFLGWPLCLLPWTRPHRARCGPRAGCILTRSTWPNYLRRRLRVLSTMTYFMLSWFVMSAFLMWKILDTPLIFRRRPISNARNPFFSLSVSVQVSEL